MIFIAFIEIFPLRGSQMYGNGKGAFLNCLIPAGSREEAERRLLLALHEDNYELVQTEFIKPYDGFTWEHTADKVEHDRFAQEAADNDDVVYGVFYTWDREE